MAIKTNVESITIHTDPLSFTAGVEVLSGSTVQTYNSDLAEYEPDRSLAPLVLMPFANAYDPENGSTFSGTISSAEWYEGAPDATGSNKIAEGTDYEIGDGTEDGFPAYALKVKKNVSVESPMEIYVVAWFNDTRTGKTVKFEASVKVYSLRYDSYSYNLKLTDQGEKWMINPLDEVAEDDGTWLHTVTAQLYKGTEAVADANAAYWWDILENGTWRAVTDEDIDIFLDCKDSSGNYVKTLKFDARMITEESFRCRAAYYEGTRPNAPTSGMLQVTTTVKVQMPEKMTFETRQTKGVKVRTDLSTEVGFELVASTNKAPIADEDYGLLDIRWMAKSAKAGSTAKEVGSGRTVSFVPSNEGMAAGYDVAVYAEVYLYSVHALIVEDGAYVQDDGKLVIEKVFV